MEIPVKYRWKLREAYFKGAGPYFLRTDTHALGSDRGEDLSFDVDAEGYFEIAKTEFPVGIFAKYQRGCPRAGGDQNQ